MEPTWQLAACTNGHLFVTGRRRMRTRYGLVCEVCSISELGRGYPIEDRVVLAVWRLAGIEAARELYEQLDDDQRSARD